MSGVMNRASPSGAAGGGSLAVLCDGLPTLFSTSYAGTCRNQKKPQHCLRTQTAWGSHSQYSSAMHIRQPDRQIERQHTDIHMNAVSMSQEAVSCLEAAVMRVWHRNAPDACVSLTGTSPGTDGAKGVVAARKGWLKNSSKEIRWTGSRFSRL